VQRVLDALDSGCMVLPLNLVVAVYAAVMLCAAGRTSQWTYRVLAVLDLVLRGTFTLPVRFVTANRCIM